MCVGGLERSHSYRCGLDRVWSASPCYRCGLGRVWNYGRSSGAYLSIGSPWPFKMYVSTSSTDSRTDRVPPPRVQKCSRLGQRFFRAWLAFAFQSPITRPGDTPSAWTNPVEMGGADVQCHEPPLAAFAE